MSLLSSSTFQIKFIAALNKNLNFVTQTQAFDGSIQLEIGDDCLWLKIYKGAVIDHCGHPSIFGYTFKFKGSEASWNYLMSGERLWADLTYPGKRYFADDPDLKTVGDMSVEITTEGNLLEAGRLTEAMFELAYTLKSIAE
jgi:hypothetical protein